MQLKKGETVFISGCTGSLGAMAIPVAKSFGLTVITNGNCAGEERVKKLGADCFIDYRKEDYSEVLSDVDYVLDTLGERELPKEFAVLKQGGSLVSLRWLPQKDRSISSFLSMKMEQDLTGSRRYSGKLTLRHPWTKCSAWMMSIWQ